MSASLLYGVDWKSDLKQMRNYLIMFHFYLWVSIFDMNSWKSPFQGNWNFLSNDPINKIGKLLETVFQRTSRTKSTKISVQYALINPQYLWKNIQRGRVFINGANILHRLHTHTLIMYLTIQRRFKHDILSLYKM